MRIRFFSDLSELRIYRYSLINTKDQIIHFVEVVEDGDGFMFEVGEELAENH